MPGHVLSPCDGRVIQAQPACGALFIKAGIVPDRQR